MERRRFLAPQGSAGFGEGTPQQDHHKEQNEQRAKFGTVVESCSKNFRFLKKSVFQKSLRYTTDRIWENLDSPSLYNGHFFRKWRVLRLLNFREWLLLGKMPFIVFGISEGKNQRAYKII